MIILPRNASEITSHVSGKPTGKLAAAIDKDFGSFDNFRKELVTKALTAFGSGWAWLVHTPTGLKVLSRRKKLDELLIACFVR